MAVSHVGPNDVDRDKEAPFQRDITGETITRELLRQLWTENIDVLNNSAID